MSGRQSRIAAEVTEGKNIRFYDTKNGSAISEMYLQNPYGIANTILTNGNGKIYMSDYRFYEQALETLENNDCKPGDIINAFNRTVDRSGISPTITTRPDGLKTSILPVVEGDNKQMEEVWTNKKPTEGQKKKKYRIRKLTEKECGRLMGYKDSDYVKMEKVVSATQRYKEFGNAIVKQVLMAIFLQMGIQGKKKWNEMSVEERQSLVDSSLDFLGEK